LDIPLYVIEIPEEGCDESYTQEIFEEIYGVDCPGLVDNPGNTLINENHAFAEGEAEYYALNEYIGLSMSIFDGPAYWASKLEDDKNSCMVPGNELFLIGDGSSCTTDQLIDADIGTYCFDNPIGEISISELSNWCTDKGISNCTHKALQSVWVGAATLGWCDSFLDVFGHAWGSYICFLESALQVGNKDACIEEEVPCMPYLDPKTAKQCSRNHGLRTFSAGLSSASTILLSLLSTFFISTSTIWY
jgi:hypothetical protein